MSIRKWWRRKFIQPPIQPSTPVDDDDLLVTLLSQAASHATNGVNPSPTDTVQPGPFTVPLRDGKPATIYIYFDPTIKQTFEFTDPAEIDGIIEAEKLRAKWELKDRVRKLREVQKKCS